MSYILNIRTGMIHSQETPCAKAKQMKEANKKCFDEYEDAVNFFEGGKKKGTPCGICLREKQ